MPKPGREYEKCNRSTAFEIRRFAYNISTSHPKQWQLLDSIDAEARKHLHGKIYLQPGTEFQSSDIEVKVGLHSNDVADLGRLVLRDSEFGLAIEYDFDENIGKADLCTEAEIYVCIRPNRNQTVDLFEVRSNILDIWLKDGLAWTIYNFITHTSYGDTVTEASLPSDKRLIAHNTSMSSIYGLIGGLFVAPEENLELRNEDGDIRIRLWPDVFNWKGLDLNSISISTVSGAITLLSSFDVPWPEGDYTHRLSVSTDSGLIQSHAPHGSFTNYSSNTGDIFCYLRPYGNSDPNVKSKIYTTTRSGRLAVRVDEAWELDGRHNPNHNTNSEHSVGNGKMVLRYGYDWFGELEADIRNGDLDFAGSSLEDVERGYGCVKAKRGQIGSSHINAHVGIGQLDIKLGLGQ